MSECALCSCQSPGINSFTVEYGYYEGREYVSKSHDSTYKSNDLSYSLLGTVTKEVCENCITKQRKTILWLSLLVIVLIISLGLLALAIINISFFNDEPMAFFGFLMMLILFPMIIVLHLLEKIKVDDKTLAEEVLWDKIESIVKNAYYPLAKSENPLMNGSIYNMISKIETDDGSDLSVETFQREADSITITYRRYIDRRPNNIENFTGKSSGIAYIPHPNKPLDFTSI